MTYRVQIHDGDQWTPLTTCPDEVAACVAFDREVALRHAVRVLDGAGRQVACVWPGREQAA